MNTSTADPPADVLVIGGGVTGLCCALALAEAGAETVVVDREVNAGSTANAGSLHVQLQSRFLRLFPELAPNVEASLPLYVAAADEWARLDALHGPFDLVREGGLMLAESDDQMRFLEKKAAREAVHGVDVALLDRTDLDRIAPWLGPHIIGAELCRNEGKLNPLSANLRLKAAAQAVGVEVVRGRVDDVRQENGAMVARGTGTWRASKVVIASAWGAGPLAAMLGISAPTVAEPLHMNITEPAQYSIRQLVQHAERPITLKQFTSGQIVIGGGWPAAAADGVPKVVPESLVANLALAARLAPAIGHLRVIRTWAGLNTTSDGKTILGRAGRAVVAVTGDAGYTLGPLVARAAAALITGQTPPFDTAPSSPERFGSIAA
ncbi:MAG: FAD-binding oxidoreductase [Pseudomonadota bacterium]